MRKNIFVSIFIIALLFTSFKSGFTAKALPISAESAIVICADSLTVLYERNAHEVRSMASTTKIMTTLLLLESGDLSREITVTAKMLEGFEGTAIGLRVGNVISAEDLAYGMMLASGNDAANAAAFLLAGSLEDFAVLMNERAREIGMTNTNFVTPSGLDADGHQSTAYDMALLGAYAMNNPDFAKIASTKVHPLTIGEPEITVHFANHNRLLRGYEGATGIKTGFTRKSGRCLVSSAERDGVRLVAVTLRAPSDWADHRRMLDYGFSRLESIEITPKLSRDYISIAGGETTRVKIHASPARVSTKRDADIKTTYQIHLPPLLHAPVAKGDVVGHVDHFIGEDFIGHSYIFATEDVAAVESTPLSRMRQTFLWIRLLISS